MYLVFGTNIGTCITAILASIGGNLSSKRLACGNTLFNIVGTCIALAMAPLYLKYVPLMSTDVARQIANTHTLFNVINTIVFLPVIPLFVILMTKIIPGEDYTKKETKYLDKNLLTFPDLAIRAVIREMAVMLDTCVEMMNKARKCSIAYDHKLRNEIALDEESVDDMQKYITEYLVEITRNELAEKHSRLIPACISNAGLVFNDILTNIERLNNHLCNITKGILHLGKR